MVSSFCQTHLTRVFLQRVEALISSTKTLKKTYIFQTNQPFSLHRSGLEFNIPPKSENISLTSSFIVESMSFTTIQSWIRKNYSDRFWSNVIEFKIRWWPNLKIGTKNRIVWLLCANWNWDNWIIIYNIF